MQTTFAQGFCEQDLQHNLAKLLCELKNPYSTTHTFSKVVKFSTTLPCSSVKLQVNPNPKRNQATLDINFVHILFTHDEHVPQAKLRLESMQFNKLMEKVLLPVFIWENRSTQQFELHWQEHVPLQFNSSWIWSVFEQSLSLASAFKERLGKHKSKSGHAAGYWN